MGLLPILLLQKFHFCYYKNVFLWHVFLLFWIRVDSQKWSFGAQCLKSFWFFFLLKYSGLQYYISFRCATVVQYFYKLKSFWFLIKLPNFFPKWLYQCITLPSTTFFLRSRESLLLFTEKKVKTTCLMICMTPSPEMPQNKNGIRTYL